MKIEWYLDKQKELDQYIIETKNLHDVDEKVRLTNTILAMIVEASELANEVRSFKHWSNKPMSMKSVVIDEYVDVMHFFLSLANQLGFTAEDIHAAYMKKNAVNFERQKNNY